MNTLQFMSPDGWINVPVVCDHEREEIGFEHGSVSIDISRCKHCNRPWPDIEEES